MTPVGRKLEKGKLADRVGSVNQHLKKKKSEIRTPGKEGNRGSGRGNANR